MNNLLIGSLTESFTNNLIAEDRYRMILDGLQVIGKTFRQRANQKVVHNCFTLICNVSAFIINCKDTKSFGN